MAKTKPSKQTKPQTQTGLQHPEEYRSDLNPNAGAGQKIGPAGPHPEKSARTAFDIKELHRRLKDIPDAELMQLRVLPEGTRLEQGATYIDLNDSPPTEFTATAEMTAGRGNYYVPKTEVNYQLWNRLIGVTNPERTGEGNEGGRIKQT
ncbi:MAG TPA: hypothetical protein VFD58_05165 [Blastocatellia bacterium]|nr:hypothetical protein [Blastocatellia bacterium]